VQIDVTDLDDISDPGRWTEPTRTDGLYVDRQNRVFPPWFAQGLWSLEEGWDVTAACENVVASNPNGSHSLTDIVHIVKSPSASGLLASSPELLLLKTPLSAGLMTVDGSRYAVRVMAAVYPNSIVPNRGYSVEELKWLVESVEPAVSSYANARGPSHQTTAADDATTGATHVVADLERIAEGIDSALLLLWRRSWWEPRMGDEPLSPKRGFLSQSSLPTPSPAVRLMLENFPLAPSSSASSSLDFVHALIQGRLFDSADVLSLFFLTQ
jgi:hypothetical protein